MPLCRQDYVPAGCLAISLADHGLQLETWEISSLKTWRTFRHTQLSDQSQQTLSDDEYLSINVQKQLLASGALSQVLKLLEALWVDLEVCISPDELSCILRVYLLPDDVYRGVTDRAIFTPQKARRCLIFSLDYSQSAWHGLSLPCPGRLCPFARHDSAQDDESSLLQVFNKIPSPDPDPNLISDSYHRDAMIEAMSGAIPGLVTELYPYQRRSIAVMVQREVDPVTILDPRVIAAKDQDGSTWYADPVLGMVFKSPRCYEGIAGGILAEEMGSGKTIICLALILATKALPTRPPNIYEKADKPTRPKIASLSDMAAACATRNVVPWKCYFKSWRRQLGYEFSRCEQALQRNPGYYFRPAPKVRRTGRTAVRTPAPAPTKMLLSSATVIIVPNNLVSQWKQEIAKHTSNLTLRVLSKRDNIPPPEELLELDILLFSQSRFERIERREWGVRCSALSTVHFKRCIVDEGHKIGNSKIGRRSDLLRGIDGMSFSSKWIVTGTPSHGLFGIDDRVGQGLSVQGEARATSVSETSVEMEKKDLERLGSITALFLKARPWANRTREDDDTPADWATYLLLPRHNKNSHGNWKCLKAILNSLIIRHRLSEVGDLLPPVDERVVVLEGSYQDKLSLNLFAMMIIFNSVQSQRTDMDYFFHPKQRKSLLEIVHNLKQSSFFGGSFFTSEEIAKSVETAQTFLKEGKVPIEDHDRSLLVQAIKLGKLAVNDKLRNLSNRFHEIPVLVRGPLGDASHAWSLDGDGGDEICTSASLLLSFQKLLRKAAHDLASLNSLLNGGLVKEGLLERDKIVAAQDSDKAAEKKGKKQAVLAGNTKLGEDTRRPKHRPRSASINPSEALPVDSLPQSLRQTNLVSTVSAKLSYLIDSILRHQENEKILVFYENENVAWYLASMLDMLQVQHLIYAKTLTIERKAQYINTFHHNHVFRVLLMDISQAAFGLDMREASRIYFINPVLNPQVEAQAIGRLRRINQKKPVSVETLVLKDSIDEVILERKQHMTQAEHRQIKSILDVRPIYNWIKNPKIIQSPFKDSGVPAHMVDLQTPTPVFGKGFGREHHPDDGLVTSSSPTAAKARKVSFANSHSSVVPKKRAHSPTDTARGAATRSTERRQAREVTLRAVRKLRFLPDPDDSN